MSQPALPLRFADDPEFLADLPYDPEVLLLDELTALDREKSMITCRLPVHDDLVLTRSQRVHPVRHPRHLAGSLMVHATGMLGFIHAYHVLGLRHREGWIGFGTHILKAAFRKLVTPGEAVICTCQAVRTRAGAQRYFVKYRFEFKHEGQLAYESEQTAVWLKSDGTSLPTLMGGEG